MTISSAVSDIWPAVKRALGPPTPAPTPPPAAGVRAAGGVGAVAAGGGEAEGAEPKAAATVGARVVAYILLLVGLALAILVKGEAAAFVPKQGFVLFTGFYVAAQAVERLIEFVLPPGGESAQAKADRAIVVGGIALLLGIALSLILGLRFLSAVEVQSPPRWLDVFVTGLVIAGGTKPLHDLIGTIEKSKAG